MAIESFADVSAGEITLHFKLRDVDSVEGKLSKKTLCTTSNEPKTIVPDTT
jgi:hypothetical protein